MCPSGATCLPAGSLLIKWLTIRCCLMMLCVKLFQKVNIFIIFFNCVECDTRLGHAKHAALRRKSKDCLTRNRNNVSKWSDMSTRGLLFQWASTIRIQLSVLSSTKRPSSYLPVDWVLAHWNNCLRVDMSLHLDTLFRFRDNQSLLLLLNAACLAEKQQMTIL
jgi:hypothetical protein